MENNKENVNVNEKKNSEMDWEGFIEDSVELAVDYINKTKKKLVRQGFVTGALAAVSIYSIITILVLIN